MGARRATGIRSSTILADYPIIRIVNDDYILDLDLDLVVSGRNIETSLLSMVATEHAASRGVHDTVSAPALWALVHEVASVFGH